MPVERAGFGTTTAMLVEDKPGHAELTRIAFAEAGVDYGLQVVAAPSNA